jgi:hypothetical protein
MTTSIHNENLRIADASVRLSGMPGGYPNDSFEAADHSPPRLRPGAAIAFAIAAVVAVLTFIEIVFS